MKHYILRRRGHFFSEAPYEGMDWCKNDKHSCYQYVVSIVSNASGVNILVYHEDIVKVVESPSGTCENMAETTVARVVKLLEDQKVKWNVVHVRLFAHDIDNNAVPKANMEFVHYHTNADKGLLTLISN